MTSYKGTDFLLKVSDGADPETFTTIGGLRGSKFLLDNQVFDASHIASGKWRSLLSNMGTSRVKVSASGLFTDSNAEEILRVTAFSNDTTNMQLCFGNGDIVQGAFLIGGYERQAKHDGHESFAITLESAASIAFIDSSI